MSEPWILLALVTAALAAIATLLPVRNRSGSAIAPLAMLLASAALLGAAADARVWGADAVMASIANGSMAVDPRVWAALALGLVVLAALPGLAGGLGAARPGVVSILTPGAVMAMLVTASAAFLGLRATPVLTVTALGAFVFGVALALAIRGLGTGGATAWRALAASGAGLVSVAVTLAVYGAKSEPIEIEQGAAADALGVTLAYHGGTAIDASRRRLAVTLKDARGAHELAPELWSGSDGTMHGVGAGDWFGGPVVVPIGLREEQPGGHDVTWIKKGEATEVPGGAMRFDGFRIEGRDTIRMYADLTVTRGKVVDHIAPWIVAGQHGHGHEPVAADVPGFGAAAIAAIDADNKRVGLMMPHGAQPPRSSTAAFLIRTRPTLVAAWAGVVLALVAAVATWFAAGARMKPDPV